LGTAGGPKQTPEYAEEQSQISKNKANKKEREKTQI